MRKGFFILLSILVLNACKTEKKEQTETVNKTNDSERTEKQNDGLILLKGDFVFYDGAAVLQTHAEFYGIYITDKLHELNDMVSKYKNAETDMVPVAIRGRISTEDHDTILWPNKVEIVEILDIYEPNPETNQPIKLGKE